MYIICAKYRTCKYTPKIFWLLCLIKFRKLQADGLQSTSVEYRVMLSDHRSRKRTQSIVKQLNFCVIVKFVRTFPIRVKKGTKSECAKKRANLICYIFIRICLDEEIKESIRHVLYEHRLQYLGI